MSGDTFSKSFIFSEKFDSDYLFDLYAAEYDYLEEIFGTTLQQIITDTANLALAFDNGDIIGLKGYVHRMKPAFGFAGLLSFQEQCSNFEMQCAHATTTQQLEQEYLQIVATLAEGKQLIEQELERLKEFNANPI